MTEPVTGPVVSIDSCNGEPSVAVAEETGERVVLSANADAGSGDCLDGDIVMLGAPLGDRALIDALTGDTIDRSSADVVGG